MSQDANQFDVGESSLSDQDSERKQSATTDEYIDEDGNTSSFVGNESLSPNDSGNDDKMLRDQDRFLPIAIISRIMKTSIPNSGKIAKEAKECVQESVSEFISFVTSEASDKCQLEKRKTITGDDIIYAMSTLGFDNYIEPLNLYLKKYREACKGSDKPTYNQSVCSDSIDSESM